MEDPFAVLVASLDPVFCLEFRREDRYTCKEVQRLKIALECYDPSNDSTFRNLITAIRDALPYIEKWSVHFEIETVRKAIDAMAKHHQNTKLDWNKLLSHPKKSPRFQFRGRNRVRTENDLNDLNDWIKNKTKKDIEAMDHIDLTRIVTENSEKQGFSAKLSEYLKQHPDFLFDLIMKSEKNFIKIAKTRLILYLTDEQLAYAIIKHIDHFKLKKKDPLEKVDELIRKLNKILSNGCAVSTLLRSASAKPILDHSKLIQIYQSEEYSHREGLDATEPSEQNSDAPTPSGFGKR